MLAKLVKLPHNLQLEFMEALGLLIWCHEVLPSLPKPKMWSIELEGGWAHGLATHGFPLVDHIVASVKLFGNVDNNLTIEDECIISPRFCIIAELFSSIQSDNALTWDWEWIWIIWKFVLIVNITLHQFYIHSYYWKKVISLFMKIFHLLVLVKALHIIVCKTS